MVALQSAVEASAGLAQQAAAAAARVQQLRDELGKAMDEEACAASRSQQAQTVIAGLSDADARAHDAHCVLVAQRKRIKAERKRFGAIAAAVRAAVQQRNLSTLDEDGVTELLCEVDPALAAHMQAGIHQNSVTGAALCGLAGCDADLADLGACDLLERKQVQHAVWCVAHCGALSCTAGPQGAQEWLEAQGVARSVASPIVAARSPGWLLLHLTAHDLRSPPFVGVTLAERVDALAKLAALRTHAEAESEAECVVCLARPRECAFCPCGHLCVCSACAVQLPRGSPCPVCRATVAGTMRVFQ
eukprot:TRINITY_DN6277_c0_g1_i1.p1 TRINITY_DN6277_c0_g1~~TRINITY_DN6277_c0_g1_i1.p1  ORF type:complete len:303 (-),score=97.04 TRINITY_DN6277_c0_g1_i1:90-998(-)